MLARMHTAFKQRDRGFTLIELLVVIIIIGILAAIAIPVLLNQRKKAHNGNIRHDLRSAAKVAEIVNVDEPYRTTAYTRDEMIASGFKRSAGNNIRITGSPSTGYCIIGAHISSDAEGVLPGGNQRWFYYDSSNGGLNPTPVTLSGLPTTGACSTGFFASGQDVSLN